MSVVHNEAKKGEIATYVLMCGDPLRAKYIAESYLKEVRKVNKVRNMFCYTGKYKDIKVSVMGSGMGIPSMAIYCHELYDYYNVEKIIRVGTCGAYQKDLNLGDTILVNGASSDSNFASQYNLNGTLSITSDSSMLFKASSLAKKKNITFKVGDVLTSDFFYNENENEYKKWADLGILAVEMESYALFTIARKLKKKAFSILTVSDNLVTNEKTSSKQRETSFHNMMILALETIIKE